MTTTNKGYVSAAAGEIKWHYEVPEDRSSKVTLLTVGGLQVTGNWGPSKWGEQFIAWAPLLQRDKAREEFLFAAVALGDSIEEANKQYEAQKGN